MVDWNSLAIDLTTQVLRVLIPVLVALVLKWATDLWCKLKTEKPEIAQLLNYAAHIGYSAAEEYFHDWEGVEGTQKMEFAKERALDYLNALGIGISEDVVKDSITNYGVSQHQFTWVTDQTMEKFREGFGMELEEEKDGTAE